MEFFKKGILPPNADVHNDKEKLRQIRKREIEERGNVLEIQMEKNAQEADRLRNIRMEMETQMFSEGKRRLLEYEKSGEYLFHGTIGDHEFLDPRQATGTNLETGEIENDGDPAVFASPFAEMAIWRSLINSSNVPGNSRNSFGTNDGKPLYKVTENLLENAKTIKGRVFVLKKDDFQDMETIQGRAYEKLSPVEIIEVSFEDLPKNIEIVEA